MTQQEPPPKPLSEMTEEEKVARWRERFMWDGDAVMWEPNPDDVADAPPPPPQGETR